MKLVISSVIVSMALVSSLQADPYGSKPAPPPVAGPRLAKVKVATGVCSTDGGGQACPTAVKWLGEVLQRQWNEELGEAVASCAGAKPGDTTIKLGYEYNEGTVGTLDSDKAQEKWPQCIKTFAAWAQTTFLRLH
jgi:hypothetical protein